MASHRYPFIVFEGGDGCGKSTQSQKLSKKLESLGYNTLLTREPGGDSLGLKLREILLSNETGTISPKAEALLFAADRANHVESTIAPHLEIGPVICDRYILSSRAYQSAGRGISDKEIISISDWASGSLYPDHTFVLDLPTATSVRRRRARSKSDRMESEALEFHKKVRDFMVCIARENPDSYSLVDASKSISMVWREIWETYRKNFIKN